MAHDRWASESIVQVTESAGSIPLSVSVAALLLEDDEEAFVT